jgi:hypothetical protein
MQSQSQANLESRGAEDRLNERVTVKGARQWLAGGPPPIEAGMLLQ